MSDRNDRRDQRHIENESRERGLEGENERREKVRGSANSLKPEPERIGGVDGGWIERQKV